MTSRLLLLLHVGGAVLFFSNAVAAFFWKHRASRSGRPQVVAHTFAGLMTADRWVTPIAVVTIVGSGIALAVRTGLGLLSTGWILWSLGSFLISGALFLLRVLPLQSRLASWTAADPEPTFDWRRYRREARRWSFWAHLSIGAAFLALALMVLRPDLPGLGG